MKKRQTIRAYPLAWLWNDVRIGAGMPVSPHPMRATLASGEHLRRGRL